MDWRDTCILCAWWTIDRLSLRNVLASKVENKKTNSNNWSAGLVQQQASKHITHHTSHHHCHCWMIGCEMCVQRTSIFVCNCETTACCRTQSCVATTNYAPSQTPCAPNLRIFTKLNVEVGANDVRLKSIGESMPYRKFTLIWWQFWAIKTEKLYDVNAWRFDDFFLSTNKIIRAISNWMLDYFQYVSDQYKSRLKCVMINIKKLP